MRTSGHHVAGMRRISASGFTDESTAHRNGPTTTSSPAPRIVYSTVRATASLRRMSVPRSEEAELQDGQGHDRGEEHVADRRRVPVVAEAELVVDVVRDRQRRVER